MKMIAAPAAMLLVLAGCANATSAGTRTAYIYAPSVAGSQPTLVPVELPDNGNETSKRVTVNTASDSPPAQIYSGLPVPIREDIRGPGTVCKNGIKVMLRAGETAVVTNSEVVVNGEGTEFNAEGYLGPFDTKGLQEITVSGGQTFWRLPLPREAGKPQLYQYAVETHGGPFGQWVVRSDNFLGVEADFPVLRRIEKAPDFWNDKPC